jgi:arsenate reductase (glutaredoxin)
MTLPAQTLLLIHNPRCSKSRALLTALEGRGAAFEVRRYLDAPLSRAELLDLEGRLGRPLAELLRAQEDAYTEAGLTPDTGPEGVLAALLDYPVLLERPILVRGPRAAIGRPIEQALALLEP